MIHWETKWLILSLIIWENGQNNVSLWLKQEQISAKGVRKINLKQEKVPPLSKYKLNLVQLHIFILHLKCDLRMFSYLHWKMTKNTEKDIHFHAVHSPFNAVTLWI